MSNKSIYALVTSHCNLSCPYCDIKNIKENFQRDIFMKQLHDFDGEIILFGGEPTLYPDRLLDIYISDPIVNRKISSITTNLISLNDTILTILQLIPGIATSYSPTRFTSDEYQKWLDNINIIEKTLPNKHISILSTMTNELISMSPDHIMSIMSKWNYNVLTDINFEFYVGPEANEEYFDRCDEWLCEIYKHWDSPIELFNIKRIQDWYNDCTNIYTLHPDGHITEGCPHVSKIIIPDKCYNCDKSDICRPCRLQKYCSFPHKFSELVKRQK